MAEHVEMREVFEQLKDINRSFGQDYYIHRPEKLDDIVIA